MTQPDDPAPEARPGTDPVVPPAQTPAGPAGYVYQQQPTHTYDQPVAQPYPYPAYGYPPPPAPAAYPPVQRPGVATAAAVLAFVQAGITAIATVFMFAALFGSGFGSGRLVIQTLAVLAAAVGVGLLIAGGVRITSGTDRTVLMAGCVLEYVICVYYIVVFATLSAESLGSDSGTFDRDVEAARGVFIVFALMFAVMPTISLALSRSQSVTDFLRSRGR